MAGSGYSGSIDDLVNAQKQVVVATWKLDRRSLGAGGAQSAADVRTVSKTEADLEDARAGDVELVPRIDDARPAAARARRGTGRRAESRPDDGRGRCDDGGGGGDGARGRVARRAEDGRRAAAGARGAEPSAQGAGGRQEAAGREPAGGRGRRRQQQPQLRRLDALRQGAAAVAADQLRDAAERRDEEGREGRHARPDPRAREAAGRAAESAAGFWRATASG